MPINDSVDVFPYSSSIRNIPVLALVKPLQYSINMLMGYCLATPQLVLSALAY